MAVKPKSIIMLVVGILLVIVALVFSTALAKVIPS